MSYQAIREGLSSKPTLIDSKVNFKPYTTEKDFYVSLFHYSEEHKRQLEQKGTLSGIVDTTTNKLYFDFDSKEDLELARRDSVSLVRDLIRLGVHRDAVQAAFTGSKGFSVELLLDKEINQAQFKSAVFKLAAKYATFDRVVNDPNRIVRVINTKHPKTGLYKVLLNLEELRDAPIDTIKEIATSPREYEFTLPQVSLPEDLLEAPTVAPKITSIPVPELDFSRKAKGWSNCKWSLLNGNFQEGGRHYPVLAIIATCRSLNYPKETAYYMAKSASKASLAQFGGKEYNKKEIWNQVEDIYAPTWHGGTFSCKDGKSPWLTEICNALGHNKCKHEDVVEAKPIKFEDLVDDFKTYVKNIEKNTITTGLKDLDAHVFLSTGANVGIIGAAGCHAKDTGILMYNGTIKKVQDVVLGDLLMGPDSKPREVLKLRRGKETMVKIKPLRSEEFVVNMNHILHLSPSHLKDVNKLPGNLNITVENYIKGLRNTQRTMLSSFKLIKTGVEFKESEVSIPPYILGLWLGDGTSSKPELTTMDEELRNAWWAYADSLGLFGTMQSQIGNKSNTYGITGKRIVHNTFFEQLKKYNLLNNKHIPKDYLISSRKQRLELLAGLIDTDGYCESNKRGWEISQKSEKLANNIVFLARSLGFHARINSVVKSCMSKGKKVFGTYFVVYISGQHCSELPVKLQRKRVLVDSMSVDPLRQGFSYEILPEDNYYGFTLDDDHLYLTEDFFIHHNSGKTSVGLEILNHTSKQGVRSVVASLDMAKNRIFEKIMYRLSGYSRKTLYDMFKEDKEGELMKKLNEEFGNVNFFKRSCPTVADIKEYVQKCNETGPDRVKLVVIDYFERITSDFSDDTAASKKIAGELQDLVDDLDICLVTLVQPNKHAISGGPDTPIYDYTKIKGSSFVYQAFRIIVSCWRPYYNPKDFSKDHFMQMAVLKNDLGELTELVFGWQGKQGLITDLDDQQKADFNFAMEQRDAEKAKNSPRMF